jgi:hypothetical protein
MVSHNPQEEHASTTSIEFSSYYLALSLSLIRVDRETEERKRQAKALVHCIIFPQWSQPIV